MRKQRKAPARRNKADGTPAAQLLLTDERPHIEGTTRADGTLWLKLVPTDPAPSPAPPRPKSVAELCGWIMRERAFSLDRDPNNFQFFGSRVADFLDDTRSLGLTPPVLPFPVESTDRQEVLQNMDTLLRELESLRTAKRTEAADKRTAGTDKQKRPLNDEARACINAFKRQRKSEPDVRMKRFCTEYATENGCSFNSLYRTITDHPEAWKTDTAADKTADNPV